MQGDVFAGEDLPEALGDFIGLEDHEDLEILCHSEPFSCESGVAARFGLRLGAAGPQAY